MVIENKKIFIFGGSGSLGNKLIEKYIDNNIVINYSRDECKHWKMELKYNNDKLINIIGNICDYNRVEQSLIREQPHIIIIASAMKHIDKCEYSSSESLNNNLLGIKNVLDVIENRKDKHLNLETVVFVSTDKACSPINIYGMCKALSEKLTIEKSHYVKDFKFVAVRYGNVLNSRGSIIPILHNKGKDKNVKEFTLTDERMTRFVMTLEDSCNLIEYAILEGKSGDIIVPKLKAVYVKDMFEIFSELYNKPIRITGLRVGEKMNEDLINKTQSARTEDKGKYYHIRSNYENKIINNDFFEYHSGQDIMDGNEFEKYLREIVLI